MQTVLITGGTGMIGTALTKQLTSQGYQVIILTRKAKPPGHAIEYKEWDVTRGTLDKTAITKADYIIHLAGANVAEGRWTKKRKKEIIESRAKSGELLVRSMKELPHKVKAVISTSAIGWYGPDPKVPNPSPFMESAPADHSFLGKTCQQWESAIRPVEDLPKRLVVFRTGIVLSRESGAYAEFKRPLGFGLATIMGSGKQVVSWIHIDDLVRLFITAMENQNWQGVYNAVAPYPVTNKELILTIAKQRRRFYIPVQVPAVALKLALGEMSIEVLKSATVSAAKVQSEGFQFNYPTIQRAIENLSAS